MRLAPSQFLTQWTQAVPDSVHRRDILMNAERERLAPWSYEAPESGDHDHQAGSREEKINAILHSAVDHRCKSHTHRIHVLYLCKTARCPHHAVNRNNTCVCHTYGKTACGQTQYSIRTLR